MRKIGPHYIYFSKGSMYVVAEDLETGSTKVFALPRMSDAKMTEDAYEGKTVDPEELFQTSFGIYRGDKPVSVKVEFSRELAPYVRERSWHASQRVVAKSDGSIHFHMDVALTPELVNWVLGFEAGALVLEPAELKEAQVLEAAEAVAKKCKGTKAA